MSLSLLVTPQEPKPAMRRALGSCEMGREKIRTGVEGCLTSLDASQEAGRASTASIAAISSVASISSIAAISSVATIGRVAAIGGVAGVGLRSRFWRLLRRWVRCLGWRGRDRNRCRRSGGRSSSSSCRLSNWCCCGRGLGFAAPRILTPTQRGRDGDGDL